MKKKFQLVALAIVLVVLGGGGYYGRVFLRNWLERGQVNSAKSFLEKGDLRSATLAARQVLQTDPTNLEATRLMADASDKAHSIESILWKQRLVELTHGSPAALESLAMTAAQFGESFTAEHALEQIREEDRETVAYHQAAAALAGSISNYNLMADHFEKALALEPKNELLQYNVAALQLQSNKPDAVEKARATLNRLLQSPDLRQNVLRALLSDARLHGDNANALKLATQLSQGSERSAEDYLLYLEELQHAGDPTFEEKLRQFEEKTRDNSIASYRFFTWLNAHGQAARTVEWSSALPETVRSQAPLPMAIAEACIMTGNWKSLNALVANVDWGLLDFLRLAFYARGLEGDSQHAASRLKWERAITSTAGDTSSLSILGKMAESWGWKDEAAQAWWLVARHNVGQRPALQHLYRIYEDEKNTPELYELARRIFELEPTNPGAANNLAYFSLLLGKELPKAHVMAEDNYHKMPFQPAVVATYAYSLLLQKRTAESLALMKQLPEPALRQPAMAACYGAILAASGDKEKAVPYLAIATQNRQQLLPEEAALADAAR